MCDCEECKQDFDTWLKHNNMVTSDQINIARRAYERCIFQVISSRESYQRGFRAGMYNAANIACECGEAYVHDEIHKEIYEQDNKILLGKPDSIR